MQKVTPEEVAIFFYKRAVPIPNWEKEQDSYKYRFYIEAERLVDELDKAGMAIVKLEVEVTSALPPSPIAEADAAYAPEPPPSEEGDPTRWTMITPDEIPLPVEEENRPRSRKRGSQ
jgi:hypothetical protein